MQDLLAKPTRRRGASRRLGACAALWLAVGCSESTVIVGKLPSSAPGTSASRADGGDANAANGFTDSVVGPDGSAAPLSDAATNRLAPRPVPRSDSARYLVSIEAGTRGEFCQRTGSAVASARADASTADCEARLERRIFAYGLCACEELRTNGDSFLVDSFDSSQAPYSAGQTGGNIGVSSARLQLGDMAKVLGSVWVAGEGTLTLAAQSLLVAGDLKTNATLLVMGESQRIARDLWVASDVRVASGSLQVDGDAYQAPGRTGHPAVSIAGQRYASDYRVTEPCNCDADAPIDVAALVADARDHNDNADASFAPEALDIDSFSTDFQVLPCGRLHASRLTLGGPSTYIVWPEGRSALFIQGDLTVSGLSTLFINPASNATPLLNSPASPGELDLFVAGDLIVEASSTLALGDSTRPAATRVFVAGQIDAQGTIVFSAQLYAPNATFSSPAVTTENELYGSIFARTIELTSKRFHYDRAILRAGEPCAASAPQRCAGCGDCPDELACSAGRCQACATDADCCEPTACSAGRCQVLATEWP